MRSPGNKQQKDRPKAVFSVALMEVLKPGYMERATPPPIIVPSRPKSNLCGTTKPVESKKLFRRRNSSSVADATHYATAHWVALQPPNISVRIIGREIEHTPGRGSPPSTGLCRQIVTLAANCSQNSRTK
jgi:hypothetical protein